MIGRADIVVALAFAAFDGLLVIAPRRLFEAVRGAPLSWRADPILTLGLLVIGVVAFKSGLGGPFAERLAFALACQVLAAVTYADLRFLVIPDLYSGLLLALALIHAFNLGDWIEPAVGALVCGGLLGTVAWVFRRMRGVDGVGLGDVKLAVALGALLGPQWSMRAVAAAAVCAALALLAVRVIRRAPPASGKPLVAPFGAALAVASAGAYWLSVQ